MSRKNARVPGDWLGLNTLLAHSDFPSVAEPDSHIPGGPKTPPKEPRPLHRCLLPNQECSVEQTVCDVLTA